MPPELPDHELIDQNWPNHKVFLPLICPHFYDLCHFESEVGITHVVGLDYIHFSV